MDAYFCCSRAPVPFLEARWTKEKLSSKSNYLSAFPISAIILQGILRSRRSRIECLKTVFAELLCKSWTGCVGSDKMVSLSWPHSPKFRVSLKDEASVGWPRPRLGVLCFLNRICNDISESWGLLARWLGTQTIKPPTSSLFGRLLICWFRSARKRNLLAY